MNFSIMVDGGNIKLDEKVDCRVLIDGFIYLGRFVNDRDKLNTQSFPIKLGISAYYYRNIGCLVMIRSIVEDTVVEHRSLLTAWNGGLVSHMEVDRFLTESMVWAAARVKDVENLRGGIFSKDRFECAESLTVLFNPPEPRMPTPMTAATPEEGSSSAS